MFNSRYLVNSCIKLVFLGKLQIKAYKNLRFLCPKTYGFEGFANLQRTVARIVHYAFVQVEQSPLVKNFIPKNNPLKHWNSLNRGLLPQMLPYLGLNAVPGTF